MSAYKMTLKTIKKFFFQFYIIINGLVKTRATEPLPPALCYSLATLKCAWKSQLYLLLYLLIYLFTYLFIYYIYQFSLVKAKGTT